MISKNQIIVWSPRILHFQKVSGSRESWATTLQSQNFSHERKKHTRAIRKKLLLIKVNPKNNFSFVENYPQKDHLFLFSVVTTNL